MTRLVLLRLGYESDNFQSSSVDLLRELVDGDVRRRCYEYLSQFLLGHVVDNSC